MTLRPAPLAIVAEPMPAPRRCPTCGHRLEPRLDDGIGRRKGRPAVPEVYGVREWRCPCGMTSAPAIPLPGVTCRLCGTPCGPMRHCGRAHAKMVGGAHPEPSVAFRIPAEGYPIAPADSMPTGPGHHNESVVLERDRWRPVPLIAAAWFAGVRRRHGPWIQIRLAPGQWRYLQRRAPWIVKATDAVRLGTSFQAERFCDLFKPYHVESER